MAALASKARRLELARGIGRDGKRIANACVGLVWSDGEGSIDVDTLEEGELVVTDYRIDQHVPGGGPSLATSTDRVTEDSDDFGHVYAWDGSSIGRVLRSARGGIILEFAWPEGLAAAGIAVPPPGEAAAAGAHHPPTAV
jgi:hypothetical protein